MYNISRFLTQSAELYNEAESSIISRGSSIGTVTSDNVGDTVSFGAGIGNFAGVTGSDMGVGATQGAATGAVKKKKTNSILDGLQTILDIVGFIPGLGDVMDGINVAISICRGDILGAALSAIGLIPVIGSAVAVPLKTILRAAGNADEIASALKILANIFGGLDKVVDGLKAMMNAVVDIIKNIPDTIASLGDNWLVKKALGNDGVEALGAMVAGLSKQVDEVISKCDEMTESVEKAVKDELGSKSAKGLIGKDFEDFLTKQIGGNGSFSKGGREFDGGLGTRWWEAKSGEYWDMLESDSKQLEKFKSDMGDRLRIARENDKTYELFSNTPIPQSVKDWLTKKGIGFTEYID
jgi:hypothetical protein